MTVVLISVLLVLGLGAVFGVILALASHFFAVKADERAQEILAVLPGANCGGCGYTGCANYAEALAAGKAKPNLCAPGGKEVAEKLADLVGGDGAVEVKKAHVLCGGTASHVGIKMDYQGVPTCAAAAGYFGGQKDCRFACLGFGDCVAGCAFGALSVVDGVAVVDKAKCTGCTTCVARCPKHIITMLPAERPVAVVECQNHDKGAVVRKTCTAGCIACQKCVRTCPAGAIAMRDNLAVVDPDKCTGCGKCIDACPVHCIAFNCASLLTNASEAV